MAWRQMHDHTRTTATAPGLQLIIDIECQGATFLDSNHTTDEVPNLDTNLDTDDSCRTRPFVTFCQAL